MKKKKITIAGHLIRILLKLLVLLVVVTSCQVLTFKFVTPPFTVNMVYEWIRGHWFDKPYVTPVYEWKDLHEISPHLRRAVIASEDQRFLNHHGFDFLEIRKAVEALLDQKGLRGASTISMQAARSLFLPSSRGILRKAAEAYYTVLIELFWDKSRILEIYLNTVDWGTGIVGAQAGANAFFSCDAGRLDRRQAALMAAVLPSPHKWSVTRPSEHVKKRGQRILKQMNAMPAL